MDDPSANVAGGAVMRDFMALFWLRPIDGINLLILLVLIWILYRIIFIDDRNSIVWADYISSPDATGRQRGDLNKVGQVAGIFLCVSVVTMYADNTSVEPMGLSALLTVALAFLGGVTMYATWIRSKQGSKTTVTEPAPAPQPPMKTTVTEPVKENKQ